MTRRQLQVLDFIRSYIEQHGIAPSRREIMAGCGFNSVSQANVLVDALAELGRIKRLPSRARAIELVPDAFARIAILEKENAELKALLGVAA